VKRKVTQWNVDLIEELNCLKYYESGGKDL